MNKNSKKLALYIFLTFLVALVATVLRTVSCVYELEDNLIYFDDEKLNIAAGITLTIGVLLITVLSFFLKKESLKATFSTSATYVPAGIVGAALLLFSLGMNNRSRALEDIYNTPEGDTRYSIASALAIIVATIALISIIYFFFTVYLTERHAQLRAYFSVATLLLCALYAAYLYFTPTTPLNAPNKLSEQMAYLFVALFFLYETRISLGRELWRPYIAFGLIGALLSAYASIPAILTYLIRGVTVTETLHSAILLLAFFIFISARLCLTVLIYKEGESPEMTALREFAEVRQSELDTPSVADGTQISIEELIDITASSIDEDNSDGGGEPIVNITTGDQAAFDAENNYGAEI